MLPRGASLLSLQSALATSQDHLAELSSSVFALVLCVVVLTAAIASLIVKPSPRHKLILDLWSWVEHEDPRPQSVSRLAA